MSAAQQRRRFLTAAASSGAAALGGCRRRGTIAQPVTVGMLGVGDRGRELLERLVALPGVRVAALADPWSAAIAEARALCPESPEVVRDYRAVLDRRDVDAVVIATPDHWHSRMLVDSCAAGKDAYVEKPLTHSEAECRLLEQALAGSRSVIQVGTQQRSLPHLLRAREILRSGRLGRVVQVQMRWNRNRGRLSRRVKGVHAADIDWPTFLGDRPSEPFDPFVFRNWRWFWRFGGGLLGDLMAHWIDLAHWFLDLDRPADVLALGDVTLARGVWETPDTVHALLGYPGGIRMHFEANIACARGGAGVEFLGTEATLYVDRGRYELHPEPGGGIRAEARVLGRGPRGADSYPEPDGTRLHLENWLDCIRTRREPDAPLSAGLNAARACHLANESVRSGGRAVSRRAPSPTGEER